MPIVEGLFSKIPVITSQGGCFPEAGGDGAVYVNPNSPDEIADRVEQIMGSQELRNELVAKGIRHAGRFTQERIENDILNFHRTISIKNK
jgi:glycosyltransferase involved in cell wall biosynthesis